MDVHNQIAAFLAATEASATVSPGPLQDLLFDCWSAYKDTPAQPVVEQWLGLTIARSMFTVDEVRDLLQQIRDMGEPVSV